MPVGRALADPVPACCVAWDLTLVTEEHTHPSSKLLLPVGGVRGGGGVSGQSLHLSRRDPGISAPGTQSAVRRAAEAIRP